MITEGYLAISSLLACPNCTYSAYFPLWKLFAGFRLLAVLAIGFRSFDPIRLLGLFALFEVAYFFLWKVGVWFSHPAVIDGLPSYIALIGVIILAIGVPAALLMRFASKLKYFRKPEADQFSWMQVIALVACLFVISFVEGNVAASTSY